MSDQQSPMTAGPSIEEVQASLLRAIHVAAITSAGVDDVREVREYGAAAQAFAQAYVTIDPNLVAPQGVRPEVLAKATPKPEPAQPKPAGGKP